MNFKKKSIIQINGMFNKVQCTHRTGFVLIIISLCITLLFYSCGKETPGSVNVTGNNTQENNLPDATVLIDELHDIYNKLIENEGYTKNTLLEFEQIEESIYANPIKYGIYAVSTCYIGYIRNLIEINDRSRIPIVMDRWTESVEKLCDLTIDINFDFTNELLYSVEEFVRLGLYCGTEFDVKSLYLTEKIHAFFEQLKEKYIQFEFDYYVAKINYSYVLFLNCEFDKSHELLDQIIQTEYKMLALPVLSYHYLFNNMVAEAASIYESYAETINDINQTQDAIDVFKPVLSGIFDDLYQFKKRQTAVQNIDAVLESISFYPVLNIIFIEEEKSEQVGIKLYDKLIKYNGDICMSYNHFSELRRISSDNDTIELIRDGKIVSIFVPTGKLGIYLEEDIAFK